MTTMKKLVSLILAVMMLLSVASVASATETAKTYTISTTTTGHTYKVFQIFTGDISDNKLVNIKWGENGTGETGTVVDDEVLADLTTASSLTTRQARLAEILEYVVLDDADAFGAVTFEDALEEVPAGYYLVKDADTGSVSGEEVYTAYIVKVGNNINIEPKSDAPFSEKKVKDTNDSTGETSDWQDSADHDIGDEIEYKITATLPDNAEAFADYKTYFLNFVDEMSKGLEYVSGSSKVYVNGNLINDLLEPTASDSTATEGAYVGGKVYRWAIADVKATPYSATAGATISIEYKAKLTADANIGEAGNPNKMHIEFDNNPNNEGTGEFGTTPDDTNIVFTYKTVVNKTDGTTKQSLTGAEFKLEKVDEDSVVVATYTATKDEAGTTFTFTGLDDGDYVLTETVTPAGYNTVAPIKFTVSAGHVVSSDNPTLTNLSGDTYTGEVSTGAVTVDVENFAGATLPETGGIGTTIFYAVGGLLVVMAVVLLITKRRVGEEN